MSEPRFLMALASDIGLIAGLSFLGWLLASRIDRGGSGLQAISLAFPVGAGSTATMLFILSLLGTPLTLGLALAVPVLVIVGLGAERVWLSRMGRGSVRPMGPIPTGQRLWALIPVIMILLLFFAAVVVSIGRSYSTWDAAAIWGVKGYGVAREATVHAASEWGAYGLAYPLNVPLQISLFASLDGDIVPGSKLLFPLYYISLAVAVLEHWRRRGKLTAAGWGTVLVMAIPVVFDHATQGYANLPFATYVVLGTLVAAQAESTGRKGAWAMSGLCFGLAIWTRPEGLPVIGLAYIALLLASKRAASSWGLRWTWILPGLLLGGGWLAFVLVNGESGIPPNLLGNVKASILGGDVHLAALYWIGRYLLRDLLSPSVWGLYLPIVAVGSLLQLRRPRVQLRVEDRMILAAAAAAASFVFAFYYLISFSGNLEWWLDTGLSRMLMPSALLLALWAISPWVDSAGWGVSHVEAQPAVTLTARTGPDRSPP